MFCGITAQAAEAVQGAVPVRDRCVDGAGGGGNATRPRAADDFATIRARMEQLRREREAAKPSDKDGTAGPVRAAWWERSLAVITGQLGTGRVRQSDGMGGAFGHGGGGGHR